MMSGYRGLFTPLNPAKYVGDLSRIRFRSSWELNFMQRLDERSSVIHWASEPIAISYINPLWPDRVSRYVPDFVVQHVEGDEELVKVIVEIKPIRHAARISATREGDSYAQIVNSAKWKAASAFAARHGASFRVLTPESLKDVRPLRSARILEGAKHLCALDEGPNE